MDAPPPDLNLPDLHKKVLGFRLFGVSDCGLGSLACADNYWMPGPNKARCEKERYGLMARYLAPPNHEAPHKDCFCGLYAWHERLEEWNGGDTIRQGTHIPAAIVGWGKIEVHRTGFRAEYAEIVQLAYDPYGGPRTLARIQEMAHLYGDVPVVPIEDLKPENLKQYGEGVPKSLLPEQRANGLLSAPGASGSFQQLMRELGPVGISPREQALLSQRLSHTASVLGPSRVVGTPKPKLPSWVTTLASQAEKPEPVKGWGYGRSDFGIGWCLYKDGERISWVDAHPLGPFEAAIMLRWEALKEFFGFPTSRPEKGATKPGPRWVKVRMPWNKRFLIGCWLTVGVVDLTMGAIENSPLGLGLGGVFLLSAIGLITNWRKTKCKQQ